MRLGIAGGEVRLAEIMKGFLKKGWDVHFLTNGGGKIFCDNFKLDNVTLHNFNISEGTHRIWVVIFTMKVLLKFPRSLRNFDGYVYTANELLFDIIPALRLKLLNRNKWIAIVHWMPPIKFWKRKKSNFFVSLLFMIGERLSVLSIKYSADLVLAVSNPTKKQLLSVGLKEKKVFSVNCGVNFKEISNITQNGLSETYDAVFMKRIQAVKGVFDLIEIWKMIVDKKPNAKLAIIGGGCDNEKIIASIKDHELNNNMIFLGPIFNFDEKFKIIKKSKIFILPSYEENWAIVMGEAMASKIPVLAYDLPELIEVWGNSFISIPLGNKKIFAEKIINFLDNESLRKKQAEIGYEYVQQFEWATIADNEINLIKSL